MLIGHLNWLIATRCEEHLHTATKVQLLMCVSGLDGVSGVKTGPNWWGWSVTRGKGEVSVHFLCVTRLTEEIHVQGRMYPKFSRLSNAFGSFWTVNIHIEREQGILVYNQVSCNDEESRCTSYSSYRSYQFSIVETSVNQSRIRHHDHPEISDCRPDDPLGPSHLRQHNSS